MGLFQKVKDFFSSEKDEQVSKEVLIEQGDLGESFPICDICQASVIPEQKSSLFAGKRMHLSCLRKLRRQGEQEAFG